MNGIVFPHDNHPIPKPVIELAKLLNKPPLVFFSTSFIVAVMYLAFRGNLFPLFNSDPYFMFFRSLDVSLADVFAGGVGIEHAFVDAFGGYFNISGYRPLSTYLESVIGFVYRTTNDQYHWLVLAANAALIGTSAFCIQLIAFYYRGCVKTAVAAGFLFMFSLASVNAFWHNLFSAFYAGVYAAILIAITGYLVFRRQSGISSWLGLGAFVVGSLLAPWFREVGYLPAFIVLTLESARFLRTRSAFIVLPILLSLHAIAPAALPKILGLYEGDIGPFWSLPGKMPAFDLVVPAAAAVPAAYIINEVPPLMWLLVILGVGGASYALVARMRWRALFSAYTYPEQQCTSKKRTHHEVDTFSQEP